MIYVLVGAFFACIVGLVSPTVGYLIVSNIFTINKVQAEGKPILEATLIFSILTFCLGAVIFIAKSICQASWSYFSCILTYNIRSKLYVNVLEKDMTWHDDPGNAPGVIGALLASDSEKLRGVSAEPIAAMLEAAFAILCALILGFFFSWPMAAVICGLFPILMVAGLIKNKFAKAKFLNEMDGEEENSAMKMASLLAADSISNYKTV